MKHTGLFSVWEIVFWWGVIPLLVVGLMAMTVKTSLNRERCFMDKDITAYMYLDGKNIEDLNALVNQYMADGWRPLQGAVQGTQTLVQYTYTKRCFKLFKQTEE